MDRIPHLRDKSRGVWRGPISSPLHLYVSALATAAVVTGAALTLTGGPVGNTWIVLMLAVAAAAAERGSVRLTDTTELSISPVLMLFAAVLFGPLAGGLVGAASELGDSEIFDRSSASRSPRLKWLTYTSSRFLVGAATGGVAMAMMSLWPGDSGSIIFATIIGSIAGESLELAFAMAASRLRGNHSSFSARTLAPIMATAVGFYAPVVALLTMAYTSVSPWTAPLFLGPALAAQKLFSMYLQERTLASDLQGANDYLNRSNLEFAEALVATLEQSDLYTAGHSKAVAIYSRDIAERMGLSAERQARAYLCGLVHDIGKVGLPASLLLKDGPLTLEERREMQRHSEIGESILERVAAYADVALVVRHHHERVDGEGYPDGLRADLIPEISRIIAVADAYNAMTSNRPYRDAMPSRVARLRLAQAVESQFDTAVVAAFEALLAGAQEDYRTAKREDFEPITVSQLAALSDWPESRAGAA